MPGWLIGLLFVFRPIGNFLFKKSAQNLESHKNISENPIIKTIGRVISFIILIGIGLGLLLMLILKLL